MHKVMKCFYPMFFQHRKELNNVILENEYNSTYEKELENLIKKYENSKF